MSRLQELEKKKEEEKSIKTGDYHAIDRFSYSRLVVFEKNIWDFYKQFIEKDQEYIAKKTEDKEEEKLFTEKWNSLQGEKNKFVKMTKTKNYLIQKGFEADLILSLFQQD